MRRGMERNGVFLGLERVLLSMLSVLFAVVTATTATTANAEEPCVAVSNQDGLWHDSNTWQGVESVDGYAVIRSNVKVRDTISVQYIKLERGSLKLESGANISLIGGRIGGAFPSASCLSRLQPHSASPAYLDFGVGRENSCHYAVSTFKILYGEAILYVLPMTDACGDTKMGVTGLDRSTSVKAVRRIQKYGWETTGGNGRGVLINYGGGKVWPFRQWADFAFHDEL